jgi:Family of unknown function (DUF5681)
MSGKNADKPIGYGNPPDHTKFQPGKSGNMKGRPKQSKPNIDVQSLFLDELLREETLFVEGKQTKMLAIQIIARRFARDAMKGSVKALAVFERMTGGFSLVRALEHHQNSADLAFLDAVRKKVSELSVQEGRA